MSGRMVQKPSGQLRGQDKQGFLQLSTVEISENPCISANTWSCAVKFHRLSKQYSLALFEGSRKLGTRLLAGKTLQNCYFSKILWCSQSSSFLVQKVVAVKTAAKKSKRSVCFQTEAQLLAQLPITTKIG